MVVPAKKELRKRSYPPNRYVCVRVSKYRVSLQFENSCVLYGFTALHSLRYTVPRFSLHPRRQGQVPWTLPSRLRGPGVRTRWEGTRDLIEELIARYWLFTHKGYRIPVPPPVHRRQLRACTRY